MPKEEEEASGTIWRPVFFRKREHDAGFERLEALKKEKESLETGFWVWD
jgi:hypothetical protein